MNKQEMKERAAAMLKTIPFPSLLGFELTDIDEGIATIKCPMRDDLRQPYGFLHGGATAALIDTAMAFACIAKIGTEDKTTTIDLTVQYLRPHLDGDLFCTAKVVRAGKRVIFLSAVVLDSEGREIATSVSTYSRG
jgi:acyl-CoA thioesterase